MRSTLPRLTPRCRIVPCPKTPTSRSWKSRSSSAGASATSTTSRCAAARARRRSSSTKARRRPTAGPARTTSWRACSRTSSRATRRCRASTATARAAGTATGCRSRSPCRSSSASSPSSRSRNTGSRRSTSSAASSVFEFLEDWTKLTERIGYWVDLDDPYRTLDTPYIESVWWALKQLWDKDLLYEGFKVVPYCPRDGTSLSVARGLAGLPGRRGPERLRQVPGDQARGRAARGRRPARVDDDARGRWSPTPRSPSTPGSRYVRSSEGYVLAEALAARVLGDGAVVADRFTGADMVGAGYEPPFPFIPASEYGEKGHTVLPGGLRLRRGRHRHRAHRDRVRRGRLPARRRARPQRHQPGARGRHLRRAHRPVRGRLRQGRRPRT